MESRLALEILSHCRIADVSSPWLSWLGFVVEERGLLDAAERIGVDTEFEAMAAWRSMLTTLGMWPPTVIKDAEEEKREKRDRLRGIII